MNKKPNYSLIFLIFDSWADKLRLYNVSKIQKEFPKEVSCEVFYG